MATLRLQLFGRFCVSCAGRLLYSFESIKVQELLCYLSLYRKPHARETLAGLFWSESSASQAKKYLRQALWQLQATLESNLGPIKRRVAVVEGDWVWLNEAQDLWVDVADFERVYDLTMSADLQASTAQLLHEAVQLYKGDLLEGCYQDWCLYERERFQTLYLAALDRLIVFAEANKDIQRGLAYAGEILRYDPARERAHRQMMRLYSAAGDRTAALRQYKRCVTALKTELGVRPAARTIRVMKTIQTGEDDPALASSVGQELPAPEIATHLLPEVLNHLKEVRATLRHIQREVQQDIRTVELALSGRR
jgi:DNA-binding SARP family transcriptional activator